MSDETRPWWRPRKRRAVAIVTLGALIVGLVLWGQRDTSPVGHFVSSEAKDEFVSTYDAAMARLPSPDETHDIRTSHGIVRVYRFAADNDSAPPLVLLPGRSSSTPLWSDNLPSLLKHRSVYTIDMLGEPGMSVQDKPITGDEDSAQWLHELLAQLPEDQVHLVGLSFGGWSAVNLLRHHPEKIASATLVEPVFVFGNLSLNAIIRSIPASVRWLPKSSRDAFASWTAGGADIKDTPEARLIESGMQGYALKLPVPSLIGPEAVSDLNVPLYAIVAGDSPMHDPEEIATAAQDSIGKSNVSVYKGASHAINGEHPDQLADDIASFVEQHDP